MNFPILHLFWNPSRIAFTIPWLEKEIYWYSLFFAIGLFLGYRSALWALLSQKSEEEQALYALWMEKLLIRLVVGITIGARLAHVLFYEPHYYFLHPEEIFMTWKGGLASHGGALGALLASYLFWKNKRIGSLSWEELLDTLTFGACWTAAAIRIGNFFNQEIIGSTTSSPFGIIFGSPMDSISYQGIPHHPVQLYESISASIIGLILLSIIRYKLPYRPGQLAGFSIFMLFTCRFVLEGIKLSQSSLDSSPLLGPLNMGQALTIPFLLYGLFLLVRPYNLRQ